MQSGDVLNGVTLKSVDLLVEQQDCIVHGVYDYFNLKDAIGTYKLSRWHAQKEFVFKLSKYLKERECKSFQAVVSVLERPRIGVCREEEGFLEALCQVYVGHTTCSVHDDRGPFKCYEKPLGMPVKIKLAIVWKLRRRTVYVWCNFPEVSMECCG